MGSDPASQRQGAGIDEIELDLDAERRARVGDEFVEGHDRVLPNNSASRTTPWARTLAPTVRRPFVDVEVRRVEKVPRAVRAWPRPAAAGSPGPA